MTLVRHCEYCKGTGKTIRDNVWCSACEGTGHIIEE